MEGLFPCFRKGWRQGIVKHCEIITVLEVPSSHCHAGAGSLEKAAWDGSSEAPAQGEGVAGGF